MKKIETILVSLWTTTLFGVIFYNIGKDICFEKLKEIFKWNEDKKCLKILKNKIFIVNKEALLNIAYRYRRYESIDYIISISNNNDLDTIINICLVDENSYLLKIFLKNNIDYKKIANILNNLYVFNHFNNTYKKKSKFIKNKVFKQILYRYCAKYLIASFYLPKLVTKNKNFKEFLNDTYCDPEISQIVYSFL